MCGECPVSEKSEEEEAEADKQWAHVYYGEWLIVHFSQTELFIKPHQHLHCKQASNIHSNCNFTLCTTHTIDQLTDASLFLYSASLKLVIELPAIDRVDNLIDLHNITNFVEFALNRK